MLPPQVPRLSQRALRQGGRLLRWPPGGASQPPLPPSSPPAAAPEQAEHSGAADGGAGAAASCEQLTASSPPHPTPPLHPAVVPVLMEGLTQLGKQRPQDALGFLGDFLNERNPKRRKLRGPPGDQA